MKTALKVLLLSSIACPALVWAQAGGCDAKRTSLEREITYAQAHGNANRVDGLETALGRMNANCTDEALRNASQRKVAQAQKKLAEREHDLQEARAQGKSPKKIAERQRKVDEAHADLERAQTESLD
ncbi:DUF1090 domain-containing protein [Paraburkholderia sediminicola]|uniref:DUF1090 domain-containing protein n=1 Tax=Paraburkholderia sediminicola TaxID=458836 RepID=UPI0038B98C71